MLTKCFIFILSFFHSTFYLFVFFPSFLTEAREAKVNTMYIFWNMEKSKRERERKKEGEGEIYNTIVTILFCAKQGASYFKLFSYCLVLCDMQKVSSTEGLHIYLDFLFSCLNDVSNKFLY